MFYFLQQNKNIKSIDIRNNPDVDECLIEGILALIDKNNGKEAQIPEEINAYLSIFKEDDDTLNQSEGRNEPMERGVLSPPASLMPHTRSASTGKGVVEVVNANFQSVMRKLDIPQLSAINDDAVKPFRTSKG